MSQAVRVNVHRALTLLAVVVIGLAAHRSATPPAGDGARLDTDFQVDRAMAHVMLPSLLYREQRYRLPK